MSYGWDALYWQQQQSKLSIQRCYNGAASASFVQREQCSITQRNGSFHSREHWHMGIQAQSQFYANPSEQKVGGWEGKEEGDGSAHRLCYNHCRRERSSNINSFNWVSYLFNHFPPKCERTNPDPDIHTQDSYFFTFSSEWNSDLSSVSSGQTQNKSSLISMIQQTICSSRIMCA